MEQKRHTASVMNRVLRLYEEGHSTREVEAITGVNRQTVSDWCVRAGIIRSKSEADRLQNGVRNGKPYDELQKKAIDLYVDEGLSSNEVSGRLGVSPSSVRRWLRASNLMRPRSVAQSISEKKKHGRSTRVRHAAYLFQNGVDKRRIANMFGVAVTTAECYLRDAKKAGPGPGPTIDVIIRSNRMLLRRQIDELSRLIDLGQDPKCLLVGLRDVVSHALGQHR